MSPSVRFTARVRSLPRHLPSAPPRRLTNECSSCTRRSPGFACASFSARLESAWVRASYATFQPFGATFIVQGQPAHGVFLLCDGTAKVRLDRHGVAVIARIARAGELLGVREVLTGTDYRYTAEALEPCALRFVPAAAFKLLLEDDPALCDSVLRQLTAESDSADRLRAITMMDDMNVRVASFLLDLVEERGRTTPAGVRFTVDISHREIGQMIGVVRETVTRKLSELRRAGLLVTKGTTFIVPDRAALEEYCNARRARARIENG